MHEFKTPTFLLSSLTKYPPTPFDEIAFVGRSNVGKSSLINHLLRKKKLAFVSATPGKTQLINFFNIDDSMVLADLPGYGYAKHSKKGQEAWRRGIDKYLNERKQLKLIIFLLDIRRVPSKEDLLFIDWAKHTGKNILIVFTKIDKVKSNEKKKSTEKNLEILFPEGSYPLYMHHSIHDKRSRGVLIQKINEALPHGET